MDDLIKGLKKFKLNQESFDNVLDESICKLCTLKVTPEVVEWEKLKSNYSKLRYLNYILESKSINLESHQKFLRALGIFMDYLDSITLIYFREINWKTEKEFVDQAIIIKEELEKSLNSNDPLKKMKYVLTAYNLLVQIVEKIQNEKFVEFIDDQAFLENFEFKRQKIN
jgi:hypothetical protein